MENQLSIALSKNKLLKNSDISKINLAGIHGRLITAGEGEILYREGDASDTIYIVVSGEVNVIKKRLLGKTKSYVFLENEFFGNEEYFEETSRTSTAVALRDCYLITLSGEEIENLVNQDHQIYLNLREPVEEVEEDFARHDKINELTENKINLPDFEVEEKLTTAEPELDKQDEDFFKSIADVSRAEEASIIPPADESTELNTAKEDFEMLSFDDDVNNEDNEGKQTEENFLNEDGIPKPEFDLGGYEKDNEKKASQPPADFDESAFLNEDGIPKSEFEIPENLELQPLQKKTHDLDDALFNILSGGSGQFEIHRDEKENDSISKEKSFGLVDEQKAPTEIINNEDENFFASFTGTEEKFNNPDNKLEEEFSTEHKTMKNSANEGDAVLSESQFKTKAQDKQEQSEKEIARPYKKHFDSEDILAEADEKLRKIERGEPVKISDNWRTISDAGGEMTSEQLQMIIKAAEFVNSTIKIDEVLANVVQVATSLTNADRGTLYLIDRDKNELWSLIAMGSETKEIRLKIGDGLAGFVALSGDVVNIKDVQRDPRFRSDFDKASGYKTENMLCYPIRNNKHEIIGVLQLLNSGNGEFSKLDENFLNAISIHSAIALQNAAMVDKLLQSERIQSLGKMANFLIQDIKKPVLVSRRYAEHLKSKNLQPDAAQVVDMLLEQLSQVADLVQTTSSYSEGKPMLRTLNVSLNNTLADYAVRISSFVESRNCQIISEYDKDVTVKLDVKEFYQCYVHIIKNACDAMPDGGKINVYTKREDRRIKIFFKDSGLGIPEGFKEKIFEPFMSYGKKEGTGLGLSITLKVVEAHNGKIEVQSSLGEGATFIITLPVAAAF